MSRAYRIKVQESLRRVIRASDHVRTDLEVLEILPPEQMAELLTDELLKRGFEKQGQALVRTEKGVQIKVEPATGAVTVQAQAEEHVDLEASKNVVADLDAGRKLSEQTRKSAQEELRQGLKRDADKKAAALQQQVTERLEGRLADLRKELDQAVNRVTAEALKRRAAQIGQIKELTEDQESGSLTIVVEV
jgi:FtsH ternary system domain X5